ncbi:TlpA disulfide reductase family protein [Flagellimonas sp. DF-77]|uniref:TlpA family protein disulfide reductase n=1 Tax=Flagellimonas algarum TaxID=3230298 RepID=UPI0033944880
MKVKKKTVLNILLILFILSFFVTPLGYYGKLLLNRLFAFAPKPIEASARETIPDYDWELKDADWNFFNFNRSKGKVVFINFWASWRLPSEAELSGIQELYDRYKGQVDFYIITDETQEPVEAFMEKHEFDFPVTYLIIGGRAPLAIEEPPYSYLLDKEGNIVVRKDGIADWGSSKVYRLIDDLLQN